MNFPDTSLVAYAMLFVSGALRGFTGFGFSLAAVPLLSLVMPPARAVPIVFYLASPINSAVARALMIVFFLVTAVLTLGPLAWFGLPALSLTLLERAGLSGYFQRNFSVERVRRFKPAPETYTHVATELGVETAGLCLVACHVWDTIGAQAAGCLGAPDAATQCVAVCGRGAQTGFGRVRSR